MWGHQDAGCVTFLLLLSAPFRHFRQHPGSFMLISTASSVLSAQVVCLSSGEEHPMEELERLLLLADLLWHLMCVPAAISSGGRGRHCHHRDSKEDLVSKGEEKLGSRKEEAFFAAGLRKGRLAWRKRSHCRGSKAFCGSSKGSPKFQQKALKQTKQKKSKSAEFLMVKEERAATEGIENPAFNISSTDLSAYQPSEEKVIRHDKPDSTLAAHQQKLGLQAHAEPRGNEYSRNYFDPLMGEEINPRQCGMEVSEEDPVKFDEQILYSKLMKLLDEENKMLDFQAARVVSEDFPDAVTPVSSSKACDLHRELEDEEIPSYIEQFERDVQNDIILLGSFSLEQHKGASHHKKQKWRARIHELFQRVGNQLLKTEQSGIEEEMVASFGNLTDVNTGLNGAAGPHGKVDCSKMPQPLEIHLRCLRGVKDKVPKGLYSLKVSVLSRLGGALVEWPELEEQPQARTTRPVSHGGNFYNTEIYFGQSIQTFVNLPPQVTSDYTLDTGS
ncbi:uncharacterized protein LOC135442918 [Zonotrichia leucophrys gambelii]|uniref:uncharacterized protein LOC135442918 n=1 Tax=Zonotrichia leucophrys gambelii TaxID=257770 RepID=UPI0031401348